MNKRIVGLVFLAVIVTMLTASCGVDLTTGSDTRAREIEAQTALEHQRAIDEREARRQSQQQLIELLTYIGIGLVILLAIGATVWFIYREQSHSHHMEKVAANGGPTLHRALPPGPNIIIVNLPSGSRQPTEADIYHQIAMAQRKQVVVYQGREGHELEPP